MKLVTHYLAQIANVDIYPLIAIMIFMAIFALVLVRVFTMSRSYTISMQNLPFDEGLRDTQIIRNENNNIKIDNHE